MSRADEDFEDALMELEQAAKDKGATRADLISAYQIRIMALEEEVGDEEEDTEDDDGSDTD